MGKKAKYDNPRDVFDQLNFQPEFVGAARSNLFLLGLEAKEKLDLKISGKTVSLNVLHFVGPNMKGQHDRYFIPLRYIPVLNQIMVALTTIGSDDPLRQETILRSSIQDMGIFGRTYLHNFMDSFDVHPAIAFAEMFTKMFCEMTGTPFRPFRGNDHVARSKMYNDTYYIDGDFYVEFKDDEIKSAFEVLARAGLKVQALEQGGPSDARLLPGQFGAASENLPSDYGFWKNLFMAATKPEEVVLALPFSGPKSKPS